MTAEEFWKDDPQLFVSYRTSFINKKQREMEEIDYKGWLYGLYNYDGMSRLNSRLCQIISNGFQSFSSKPKFDTNDFGSYPTKPYQELSKENNENKKVNKEQTKHEEYQNSLMYYGSIKEIYLKRKMEGE